MNTNSAHQTWSLWEYRVYPELRQRPQYSVVRENCARFGRLVFGSTSQMRIVHATDDYGRLYWEIAVLSEGHPVQDPQYTEWMHEQWGIFLQQGFGQTCEIRSHARLEAGDRQDGTPPDQLIILPLLSLEPKGVM